MDERRYAYLDGEVRRLALDCMTHSYDIGVHLMEMTDGAHYQAGGYDSIKEYIDERLEQSRTQANVALRVARNFSRDLATQFGITKCDAWLTHIRATPEDELPADIARATISVDGRMIPLSEATVAQIEAATARLKARTLPDAGVRLQASLDAALAAHAGVRAKVTESGGKLLIGLHGIPANAPCAPLAAASKALGCGESG